MGIVNKRVFNKAYMLEFLGEEKPIIFTFSIPPKGEDFDFGQRVTETKTFGGSIFDNYGNDTIKINLSGSTGNTEKKLIYRGLTQMPLYLSGEAEIFELQKTIYNWHKITSKNANKDKKVYLYDLSKMNVLEFATLKPSRNYWRVYVKDLKIKRDDTKPFTFNYTLEMYGLAEEQEKRSFSFNDLSSVVQGFTNAMNAVQSVMDYTEGALAAVEELTNTITKVKNAYDAFQTMSDKGKVLSIFKGIDSATRILTGNTNNSFYNSAKSCLSVYGQVSSWFSGDTIDTQSSKTTDSSTFRIMFNSNGADVNTQTVEYSQTVTKPDNPTKENYTFVNWYSDSACTILYDFTAEVTRSFTLYAKWQLSIATVTFNSKGGSSVIKQQVAIGNCATTPTAPTKTGFSFVQWCTDYAATIPFDFTTPITDNMTLYAAWQVVYSVTFDSNGGTEVDTQIVTTGEKAIYPLTPTKENYTFAMWCSDSELTIPFDFSTVITADTTLYAQWIQYSNTVTFDSNGGSAVESQNVHIGGNATEPTAPTQTGYSFVYWCTDYACTNEFHFNSTAVNAPLTLYAKWTALEITVTFNSNGGSSVENQTVAYNGKAIFPTIPTKENDLFLMWQKKTVVELEDAYSEYDFNTELTENITLYAKWFED